MLGQSNKVTEEKIGTFNVDDTLSSRAVCSGNSCARRRYRAEKNLRFAKLYGFKGSKFQVRDGEVTIVKGHPKVPTRVSGQLTVFARLYGRLRKRGQ